MDNPGSNGNKKEFQAFFNNNGFKTFVDVGLWETPHYLFRLATRNMGFNQVEKAFEKLFQDGDLPLFLDILGEVSSSSFGQQRCDKFTLKNSVFLRMEGVSLIFSGNLKIVTKGKRVNITGNLQIISTWAENHFRPEQLGLALNLDNLWTPVKYVAGRGLVENVG